MSFHMNVPSHKIRRKKIQPFHQPLSPIVLLWRRRSDVMPYLIHIQFSFPDSWVLHSFLISPVDLHFHRLFVSDTEVHTGYRQAFLKNTLESKDWISKNVQIFAVNYWITSSMISSSLIFLYSARFFFDFFLNFLLKTNLNKRIELNWQFTHFRKYTYNEFWRFKQMTSIQCEVVRIPLQ